MHNTTRPIIWRLDFIISSLPNYQSAWRRKGENAGNFNQNQGPKANLKISFYIGVLAQKKCVGTKESFQTSRGQEKQQEANSSITGVTEQEKRGSVQP